MVLSDDRIGYLDCIRGCMIIWMLVVHISLNYGVIQFGKVAEGPNVFSLMSFFMTPFYVFSGYLFSSKKGFLKYTFNKIKKLLLPYLFFSIWGIFIFESYSFFMKGMLDVSFLNSFIPLACFNTNTPCWFFVSLFFVSLLYYIFYTRFFYFRHIIIVACFFLAYITMGMPQYLGYGNILLGLVYYHIGQEIKIHEKFFQQNKKIIFIICVFAWLIVGLFFPTTLFFVMNLLGNGDYFLNLLFSVSACLILYYSFAVINKKCNFRVLSYFGRISLVIFASHRPILNWILEPVIMKLLPSVSYYMFILLNLIFILLFSIVLDKLLRKYVPYIIGVN